MAGRATGSLLTNAPEGLKFAADDVGAAHYRRVGGKILVTNDAGHYAYLSDEDFKAYMGGSLEKEHPRYEELYQKGFLRKYLDFDHLAEDFRRKNSFLFSAATLHILVTTLRCNHKCSYCHSSVVGMEQEDKDMSLETAKNAVDFIFQCPNPSTAIEFQGGEPTVNWPIIKYVTQYARLKNEVSGRGLHLSLVTNFSLIDEERFKFLIDNDVSVCTSLDGPAELHNTNRLYLSGNSQEETVGWIKRFNEHTSEDGKRPYKPGALMTTTRFSFEFGERIVDEYVRLGLPGIFIRPLSPIGFARRSWHKIGYTKKEYLAFYRKMLEYILEINLKGTPFFERMAQTLLIKILHRRDPNFVDLRSPSGAGLGVISYDYNGDIYTGDEARMLAQEGNRMFRIGRVGETQYNEAMDHPVVKAAAISTLLENQPLCAQCTYKPYCGQDTTYNQETQESLWGSMPDNGRCEYYMGVFDIVFEFLNNEKYRGVFEQWVQEKA